MTTSPQRHVTVAPERLLGWVERFADTHGGTHVRADNPDVLCLCAADGTSARIRLRLSATGEPEARLAAAVEALEDARVGLIVARRGGHTVGVAHGAMIVAHRTGSRYVQGRTAAGGWSQQRYARRRNNQATAAFAATADAVADILLPHISTLNRVVAGGDRQAVRDVLRDPRLGSVAARLEPVMYSVGEPKRVALDELLAKARAVPIDLSPGA